MRTLTALTCAASLAAGIATSMAQSNVYSLNVVGYYNITIGAHQKIIICNQLNTTNNTIASLLLSPPVNDGDNLFKWGGAGFITDSYDGLDGYWTIDNVNPDTTTTLNPGEAAFYLPGSTETLTFVGTVLQGSLTNGLPLGHKVLVSSLVPQQGLVSTDLGVPPDDGDNLFTYNTTQSSQGYTTYTYDGLDGYWTVDNVNPNEPTIAVGQGFFYIKSAAAAPADAYWVRNFTVQ